MHLLFYGNCQTEVVWRILKPLSKDEKITLQHIPCFTTDLSKESFTEMIQRADVIVTQPIAEGYRSKDYLDTKYILENTRAETKIILFPSLYCTFYYPDVHPRYQANGAPARVPSSLQYREMFRYYCEHKTVDEYIHEILDNPDFDCGDLDAVLESNLSDMEKREKEIMKYSNIRDFQFIDIYDYLRENIKKKLLFYTQNHPSKILLQEISCRVCQIVGRLDESLIDREVDTLSFERLLLYAGIQKYVSFDINQYTPCLYLSSQNKVEDKRKIVEVFFDCFSKELDIQ